MRCRIIYWRLSSGIEVDFILGDAQVAIEVKAKPRITPHDYRHLLEFRKEHPDVQHLIIVCTDSRQRLTKEGIRILPWNDFLNALWAGKLVG